MKNGQCIREISKTKRGLYNGNIYGSELLIVMYILVFILLVAFDVALFFGKPVMRTTNDTIEQQITFKSYYTFMEINKLKLVSNKGDVYKIDIPYYSFDAERIKALCNSTDVVTVYSTKNNSPRYGHDYAIRALAYNGDYYLTFEDSYKLEHRTWTFLVILAIILSVAWIVNFIGGIIVGRHPEKYSTAVKRLFFKSWALKENIVDKK